MKFSWALESCLISTRCEVRREDAYFERVAGARERKTWYVRDSRGKKKCWREDTTLTGLFNEGKAHGVRGAHSTHEELKLS
jgi:hypothetical protein